MSRNTKEQPVQQVATVVPIKYDFDAWWATVEKKIPEHHRKEIIKADFRARGLSLKESMQSYNEGLNKYGLKLK